ncbi:MAG: hypothetical protein MUE94_01010 [Verrucomicrobia bacterium]|jgi:hypothetical protein|nr:hypothetical protein [Verrucomicrobiota bacterium]
MDFIKKNWEKVLLGVVLVGLLIAVVSLPIKIAGEKADLEAIRLGITERAVSGIDPLDASSTERLLAKIEKPLILDLTTSNRVFNPVPWKRSPSGQLLRVNTGGEIGVGAVTVERIAPLYLIVTFDSVLTSESGSRYAIGVEKQADSSKRGRIKRQSYAAIGDKNENFLLRGIKGPPEAPTAVELELTDTGEAVTVSLEKPYARVDGYMADLAYPPDSRKWLEKRVGEKLPIERELYNIVAITKDEVVLSAPSGKKTSVKLSPGSQEGSPGRGS